MEVKGILAEPPVMSWPTPGQELQLYLAVSEANVSATLVQEYPEFKLVYFISMVL